MNKKKSVDATIKTAWISATAVVLAATIAGIFGMVKLSAFSASPSTPTPTSISSPTAIPTSIPSPTATPSLFFSQPGDAISALCEDFNKGYYNSAEGYYYLAYEQVFSPKYHDSVGWLPFIKTIEGYVCSSHGQFSLNGSDAYIQVLLENGNGNRLCRGYGLLDFDKGGWLIDQVTPLSTCQF